MPSATKRANLATPGKASPAIFILLSVFALVMLGITILFSASLPVDSQSPYVYIEKQAIWIVITFFVGLGVLRVDLEWLRKFIWLGFALSIVGLILVLTPLGSVVNGSRSWIRFGPAGFQVAEFAKIGLVFFLAHYFSLCQNERGQFFKGFVYPCLAIAAILVPILMQTDLGTAMIIAMASLCILYIAGVKLYFLIPSIVVGVGGVVALIINDKERWSRLTAFLDMEGQKSGDAYQVWQAMLAFGAGGIDGVGLGNGRQQLQFLPEAHNDFIFAIVGEELGLIATLAVVLVYAVMFIAGIVHLRKAPNIYQYLLAGGCLLMISVQAVVNLGVVTGCLPTTGLPLPFISYGGSNLLIMGICVAVLLNTCSAWQKPAFKQSKRKLKEI
ncbi:putative lipid II flippase FtsW [Puniceicoccaceae bacterium K14]|nr:putative lipid II flippase FtsW [Puniceicoccaceae bacterium K14]